jgi:DNA-binding transcriptional LysR family regulator
MDLVLLRSLIAVADAGTITEAADRLGVTQPALSRRVRQLEEHLGVALLTRGRSGVSLNTIGEMVVSEARVLAARYDHLRAEVAAQVRLEGGTVRIGGGATAVSFVLPGAIAAFQEEHPSVRFRVKEAGSREVADDVVNGQLELGLVTLPVPLRELEAHPLLEDRVVLVCHPDHALARRRRLQVTELAGLGVVGFEAGSAIRQIIDSALHAAGVEMNVVMELRSIPAIMRMVVTTGNLGFVSQMAVESEAQVRTLRVRGLDIRRQLAVIARRRATLSPAAASFAARLRRRRLPAP